VKQDLGTQLIVVPLHQMRPLQSVRLTNVERTTLGSIYVHLGILF